MSIALKAPHDVSQFIDKVLSRIGALLAGPFVEFVLACVRAAQWRSIYVTLACPVSCDHR